MSKKKVTFADIAKIYGFSRQLSPDILMTGFLTLENQEKIKSTGRA